MLVTLAQNFAFASGLSEAEVGVRVDSAEVMRTRLLLVLVVSGWRWVVSVEDSVVV
jgi:hypothetical protein